MPDMTEKLDRFTAKILAEASEESRRAMDQAQQKRAAALRRAEDQVLREAIDRGVIYVGISAGSMYAAGNLEDGLGILPNVLIPHWEGQGMEDLPNGAEEIRLKDGQAVYIEENCISF